MKICMALITIAFGVIHFRYAEAKVTDSAPGGFTIKHSFEVNKPPAEAYSIFTCSGRHREVCSDRRPGDGRPVGAIERFTNTGKL